jgi:hypothetical protein
MPTAPITAIPPGTGRRRGEESAVKGSFRVADAAAISARHFLSLVHLAQQHNGRH